MTVYNALYHIKLSYFVKVNLIYINNTIFFTPRQGTQYRHENAGNIYANFNFETKDYFHKDPSINLY